MYPSFFHNLIGMTLVHIDGTEYTIKEVYSDEFRLGLFYSNLTVGMYMSSFEFISNYMPYLSFYKDDVDDTLYPLSNIENILGL